MTDADKLEEVIQLGIERGWQVPFKNQWHVDEYGVMWPMLNIGTDWYPSEDEQELTTSDILFNHDFARAYFGEEEPAIEYSHVTRSEMPGYIDTTFPLHNSEDIRMVQQEDMKCFSCGKVLSGAYWIKNETCWVERDYNLGYKYHLQQLALLPTDSERINYYYQNRGEK